MNRSIALHILVSAVIFVMVAGGTVQAQPACVEDPVSERLKPALMSFEEADRAAMPSPRGVLFVGSSTIALWPELQAAFDEHPIVVQRGISGSRMIDLAQHADRLAIRYRPSRIVIYSGENDLAEGMLAGDVLEAVRSFVRRVRSELPQAWIAWVSIKPSPSRWAINHRFDETNALVAAWAAEQGEVEYVDLHAHMLGDDGLPRPELYAADALHLSAAGYALWEAALEARLRPSVGAMAAAQIP